MAVRQNNCMNDLENNTVKGDKYKMRLCQQHTGLQWRQKALLMVPRFCWVIYSFPWRWSTAWWDVWVSLFQFCERAEDKPLGGAHLPLLFLLDTASLKGEKAEIISQLRLMGSSQAKKLLWGVVCMGAQDNGCTQHIPLDGWRWLHWAVGQGGQMVWLGQKGRICAQHRESAKCIIPNSSILSVGSGMLESSVRSK